MSDSNTNTATDWDLHSLLAGYARVEPEQNRAVAGLALSSTRVEAGDVFLALAGQRQHGLAHVAEAERRGAVAVVYETQPQLELPHTGLPLIALDQLAAVAGEIADRFYFQPSLGLAMVGVTGTNGKTSVTHYIAQALRSLGMPAGVIGTLGSGLLGQVVEHGYTTPDAVTVHAALRQMKAAGAHAVAMEVSSHALVQHRVAGVHFDVAVFTNLSREHLDYHGDMQSYADAKRRLLDTAGLGCAVINADDAVGRAWLASLPQQTRVIAYAIDAQEAAFLSASNVELSSGGASFVLNWNGESASLVCSLLGQFNVYNLLAAAAALLALGHPLVLVAKALGRVHAVAGRMQQLGGETAPQVVIDYAHTPDALEKALQVLRAHCGGTLYCVFGCGGERDLGKRPQMAHVAEQLADVVIVTDDNPRSENPEQITNQILAGFAMPASVRVIHDRSAAIRCAIDEAVAGDCVLIAGKGHEDYQLFGQQKRFFSDAMEAAQALEAKA